MSDIVRRILLSCLVVVLSFVVSLKTVYGLGTDDAPEPTTQPITQDPGDPPQAVSGGDPETLLDALGIVIAGDGGGAITNAAKNDPNVAAVVYPQNGSVVYGQNNTTYYYRADAGGWVLLDYVATVKCPTPYYPNTNVTPITTTDALLPIDFRWDYNGGFGKCNEDEHQYAAATFSVKQKLLKSTSGTLSQSVFSKQYHVGGLIRTFETWTAPQHDRYTRIYDSSDAFRSATPSDWVTVNAPARYLIDGAWKYPDYLMAGSSMISSNVKGASASTIVDGDGFVLRYAARPFGGKMKVSIDGQEVGIIDQEVNRDQCGWQQEWQWPDELSDGTHSGTLYHKKSDTWVTVDALVLGDKIYDIGWGKTGPIQFSCIWSTCWYPTSYNPSDTPSAYGYSFWYTADHVQAAPSPFSFTGNKFSLIFNQMYMHPFYVNDWYHELTAGKLSVTIDGTTHDIDQLVVPSLKRSYTVPEESTYWKYNQEWRSPTLSKGQHVVTVEHVDDRFNKYVNVDAIITEDRAGGITTEGEYEWWVSLGGCASAGSNCGPIPLMISLDLNATPSATPSAWYQLVGGSAAAKGGDISVTVPDTAGADNNQRVLSGLTGSSDTTSTGFLMTGLGHEVDVPHYLGMTNRDWAVSDSSYFTPPTENFTYLKRLFELPTVPTESFYQREGLEAVLPVEGSTDGWTTGGLTTIKGDTYDDGNTYIYYHTGDLTVENPLTIADGTKRVIFVKGNVTINQNIQVATGSFLSIIATGNLTISGNVTKTQGVYIVDKTITIEDMDPTTTGLNRQFEGQGTFVGWQGINLNRDLQDTNSTNPAEQFIYRPDFLINAPSLYKRFGIQWQEVAPGGVGQ